MHERCVDISSAKRCPSPQQSLSSVVLNNWQPSVLTNSKHLLLLLLDLGSLKNCEPVHIHCVGTGGERGLYFHLKQKLSHCLWEIIIFVCILKF